MGLLEIIANNDNHHSTTVFGRCSLLSILNAGDKSNYYFNDSEWYIRSQGGPVVAAALKGMVVVAAHQRMMYSQEVVDGFMEINLNKKCKEAMEAWNKNLIAANSNFRSSGNKNMLTYVKDHQHETSD